MWIYQLLSEYPKYYIYSYIATCFRQSSAHLNIHSSVQKLDTSHITKFTSILFHFHIVCVCVVVDGVRFLTSCTIVSAIYRAHSFIPRAQSHCSYAAKPFGTWCVVFDNLILKYKFNKYIKKKKKPTNTIWKSKTFFNTYVRGGNLLSGKNEDRWSMMRCYMNEVYVDSTYTNKPVSPDTKKRLFGDEQCSQIELRERLIFYYRICI